MTRKSLLDLPCAAPLVGNVRLPRYLFTEVKPPLVGEGRKITINISTKPNQLNANLTYIKKFGTRPNNMSTATGRSHFLH